MASEIEVVNLALVKLGAMPITSFSEGTEEARVASATYALLRDEVMASVPWNFATTRASLAASATDPVWGLDHAYPLPADSLMVLEVNGQHPDTDTWHVEEGHIVTDLDAPLEIRYIKRVTAPGTWSPGFVEALASRLAMEWAEPLVRNTQLKDQMESLHQRSIRRARSRDGRSDLSKTRVHSSWVERR